MHILFANTSYGVGGLSSFAINMAQSLREKGHKVTVGIVSPYGELSDEFKKSFNHIYSFSRRIESQLQYVRRIASLINEIHPQLVIINREAVVQAALPLIAADVVKFTVIHSYVPQEIALALGNRAYLNAIVSVSPSIAKIVKEEYSVYIETIPVGIRRPSTKRQSTALSDPIRLIYVGRLAPEKNLPLVFEVLDGLYQRKIEFVLTVVGDGGEMLKLLQIAKESPYAKCVKFLGSILPAQIEEQFQQSDVLLLTSFYEGTPHSVIEAMAYGVIPICSNLEDSTDRMIDSGVTGFLCDNRSAQEFIDSIVALRDNRKLYRSMVENVQAFFRATYDVNLISEAYVKLYNECQAETNKNKLELHESEFTSIPPELVYLIPEYVDYIKNRVSVVIRKSIILRKLRELTRNRRP